MGRPRVWMRGGAARQPGWSQWREEFSVLREGQAAHQDCAGKKLLMGWFGGELGEEVHRLATFYRKSEYKEKIFKHCTRL